MTDCPCGSGQSYEACCEPYIEGVKPAPTAEALMRSRYSAYAVANGAYLKATLAQGVSDDEELSDDEIARTEWTGLEIKDTLKGGEKDKTGEVEFVAYFTTSDGETHAHRERSTFAREDGRWVYVTGVVPKKEPIRTDKVGRNDPCPCGSGKKYKKCCGA